MVDIRDSVTLPRSVVPQEVPPIVEGGDCGVCVLAGLVYDDPDWSSVGALYEEQKRWLRNDDPVQFTQRTLESTLQQMVAEGCIERVVVDTPVWLPRKPSISLSFGLPPDNMATQWWRYIRLGLQAGYYAIAMVRRDGDGRVTKEGKYRMTDHFVLLNGVRKLAPKDEDGNTRSQYDQHQVRVSCSSTKTAPVRWMRSDEFLRDFGGFSVVLVEPSRE